MQPPKPEVRFQENINEFFDHVIRIIKEGTASHGTNHFVDHEKINAIKELLGVYDIGIVMVMFTNQTEKNWRKIKERDVSFFLDLQRVFDQVPVKDLNSKNVLHAIMTQKINSTHLVPDADREVMWQFCESFICILVDFIHNRRKPRTRINTNGVLQPVYTAKFLPAFNIREHCRVWSIDLRF